MVIHCSLDLINLCDLSNDCAHAVYGPVFDVISRQPYLLNQIDLGVVEFGSRRVPVLINGSNMHAKRAAQPHLVNEAALETGLRQPDLLLVVPEVATLMAGVGMLAPSTATALRNIQAQTAGAAFQPLIPLDLFGSVLPESMLRSFDSHLSLCAYAAIAEVTLQRLGLEAPLDGLAAYLSPHPHDLARRFCTLQAKSVYFAELHLERETGAAGNRGIRRWYRNPRPLIDRSLLLIGDSHSYGALCQIFSQVFREVRFIWQYRSSGYGALQNEIAAEAAEADLMIEEVAERFFLVNLCQPVEGGALTT
jgi:hypothetical protein